MQEKKPWVINGFVGLLGLVAVDVIGTLLLIDKEWPALAIVLALFSIALLSSLTIVQPNQAMVVTFFGSYSGTIRRSGIWMTIPFSVRKKVSLRVRNFNSAKLKVNDIEGNPIEIAAVVVFRVVDSAKASFDVDNYEQFVEIQSETALRHVANKYPYDTFEDGGYSLRGNSDEVAAELARELQERLSVAGVEVMERV